ncbi:aminotransferase class I/II-fold pyridoxal phosphate-dependent enzyme [Cyanobium sp. Copco_Reservoir_LC18]|uniref:aminotransferase class I/II-fold pyridoxal phosphate-dependent enzyme n=1 Tax=Cyanobium sp. Copco_Reservoir_LC18 TaxID=1328305 RepID=UPI001F2CB074|nr:aminotransferase class I/II-fold pyridoxal phosphate-dependent enzyme [Cyanobium sp. Copco_Reservoir_LC18]
MGWPAPGAAGRMAAVADPVIAQVGALMRQRPDVLSLAQGMVSWAPPAAARQAVALALAEADPRFDRYGAMQGEEDLLAAVRRELTEVRGLDLEGSDLLVTAGSNMAFHAIAQVLCDPGDEVVLPLPFYFNHAMAIRLAGGVPVPVAAGLVPDPGRLAAAITPRTRAIVTISPNNPSGLVTPPEVLAAINRLCHRHGLLHVSDEAYADFLHGTVPHGSPGRLPGSGAHTVSLFSLSKAYGMAGWRVGYAAVPRQLMGALAKVQDTVLICPPLVSQRAALAALEAGPAWCRPHIAALGERRRQLFDAVAAARAGGQAVELLGPPDGAFYGLLRFPCSLGGASLLRHLVLGHGVAALPGESFGLPQVGGQSLLRLSYGMLDATALAEALGRLFKALAALPATGD